MNKTVEVRGFSSFRQKKAKGWGTELFGLFISASNTPTRIRSLLKDYWEKVLPYLDKIQINIVPDYLLKIEDTYALVLDAKAPTENILHSI